MAEPEQTQYEEPGPAADEEYLTGDEDYVESDFEGREGYRKGMSHQAFQANT